MRRFRFETSLPRFALAVALLGCETKTPPAPRCEGQPAPCACERATDCGAGEAWVCVQTVCRRLCRAAAECDAGESCEDGICRHGACADDGECGAGEHCLAGACAPPVPASAVASCLVLPPRGLLHAANSRDFTVFARDAGGRGLAFRGEVAWSVDLPARAVASGTGVVGAIVGRAEDGPVEVRATLPGGVACEPALAQNYGPVPAGKRRVVVADLMSALPIANATVVVSEAGATISQPTDARGVALFDAGDPGPRDVSVFERLHAWITYVGVHSRDLLVLPKPFPFRNGFAGSFPLARFDALAVAGETAHIGLFGSSIPVNLLDLQTATFFGDLHPTEVDLGGTKGRLLLPSGVVFGVGDEMHREAYDVFAPPGVRAVWGLGGNASFSTVFSTLAPLLLADGRVDTGQLLGKLLPLVNRFQHGVTTGLRTPFSSDLDPIDVTLDAPLRLKVLARLPRLPSYARDGRTVALEGVFVVGVVHALGQGLVPLGLTAGLDRASEDEAADGLVAPGEPGLEAGVLPLRLAPRRAGLENAAPLLIALSASFSRLGLGGDADAAAPLVFSGLVQPVDALRWAPEGREVTFPREFLPIPNGARFAGRTFERDGAVPGSTFTRLDVGSAWGGEWSIHLPNDVQRWTLPSPPEGFPDRLDPPAGAEPVELLLQSARLSGEATGLEALVTFGATTLDELGRRLEAFSTRELFREP